MDEKALSAFMAEEPETAGKFVEFERVCREFEAAHPGTATLCPEDFRDETFVLWDVHRQTGLDEWFLMLIQAGRWKRNAKSSAFLRACAIDTGTPYNLIDRLGLVLVDPAFAFASEQAMQEVWNAWTKTWIEYVAGKPNNPWKLAYREMRRLHAWPTARLVDYATKAVDAFMEAADHSQVPKPRLREMRKAADGDWGAWLKTKSNGDPSPLIRQRLEMLFRKHVERWTQQALEARVAARLSKRQEAARRLEQAREQAEREQREHEEREAHVMNMLESLREVMRQDVEKLATEQSRQSLCDKLEMLERVSRLASSCSVAVLRASGEFPHAKLVDKIGAAIALQERRAQEQEVRLERCRELIGQRVRQIVRVFNGLFDLEIDWEAVLSGEVTGEYGSIHSAEGEGIGQTIRQELRVAECLHMLKGDRTWLELEEGDSEDEMFDAFETANFIAWHELSHLVTPSVIVACLQAVEAPPDLSKEQQTQAREVVIDALAFRLGATFYMNQAPRKPLVVSEMARLHIMRVSLSCTARRLVRHLQDEVLDSSQQSLILRIHAELKCQDGSLVHSRQALRFLDAAFGPVIQQGEAVRNYYAALFRSALKAIDVTSITFRGSLRDAEEDC